MSLSSTATRPLADAVAAHRFALWGDGPVEHELDIEFYTAAECSSEDEVRRRILAHRRDVWGESEHVNHAADRELYAALD